VHKVGMSARNPSAVVRGAVGVRAASPLQRLRRPSVSADTRSGCAQAGSPYRHTGSISAAVNRRTSMPCAISKTGCSRPTGCHGAACGGYSHRRARPLWWRNPRIKSGETARLRALPWCCFAPPAGSHDFIHSLSPPNTPAAASRRPSWWRQRKPRGRVTASGCGLKCTKKTTRPSKSIARPDIMNSAGMIIKTAAMRSDSRNGSRGNDGPSWACARGLNRTKRISTSVPMTRRRVAKFHALQVGKGPVEN